MSRLSRNNWTIYLGSSRVTSFPLFLRGLGAARMVRDPSRGKPVKLV
jgi:hypothetical protein